jgi:WD40 repeat protein
LLAVGGGTPAVAGEIQLFDWGRRKLKQRLTNHTDLVTSVAFNAGGSLLAVASADRSAHIWKSSTNSSTFERASSLTGHAGPVLAIAFSPGGETVVTASADRSIKVWSIPHGSLIRTLSQHTETVHALAFRPQPSPLRALPATCASASDDRTVRIWQPEIGRMVRIIRQHQGPVFALSYSPDGKALFSAGKEGIIRRIDPDSDTILAEWPAQGDWIYTLAISPDGSTLAAGDWAGSVRLRTLSGQTPAQP